MRRAIRWVAVPAMLIVVFAAGCNRGATTGTSGARRVAFVMKGGKIYKR